MNTAITTTDINGWNVYPNLDGTRSDYTIPAGATILVDAEEFDANPKFFPIMMESKRHIVAYANIANIRPA